MWKSRSAISAARERMCDDDFCSVRVAISVGTMNYGSQFPAYPIFVYPVPLSITQAGLCVIVAGGPGGGKRERERETRDAREKQW